MTGCSRKLHYEELRKVVLFTKYYSADQTKEDLAGYVALIEETNAYSILVPEPETKTIFLRTKYVSEAKIKN
jgi:hypothetical protein